MSSPTKGTYAAWLRRDGLLVAETFEASSREEAQRIANGRFRTGQFAPLRDVFADALRLGEHFDWPKIEALTLSEREAAALSHVTTVKERRYVLVVNDHSRGDALTVTASHFPIRVAREAWREFGDSADGPGTIGEAIADVLRHCEAGVWYSIPLGNVWGAVFASDAVPQIDHLADGLKCSVRALRSALGEALPELQRQPRPSAGPAKIKPVCPACGSNLICELAKVEASYYIDHVAPAEPGYDPQPEFYDSTYSDDGEFAGYYCRDCQHDSDDLADFLPKDGGS